MKYREGFVSNSSSTSFVIIGNSGEMYKPSKLIVGDGWEFGWTFETFRGAEAMCAFALMQAVYQGNKEWEQMVYDVVREYTGSELEFDNINNKFDFDGSYIDHQSIGDSNEIFASKETLKKFIFDMDSYVEMGNDNV